MVKDIYKDKLPVSGKNCLLHKAVQNWLDKSEPRHMKQDWQRCPEEIITHAAVSHTEAMM